jgi:hypothetical protein
MNNHLANLNSARVEYYTPKWVWECLEPYEVENPLCDFFENNYGDICISNPPFNRKKEVMERLFQLNKPFMLILPQIILNTVYFSKWAKKDPQIQIIVLPKRVDFYNPQGQKKQVIHTLVVCWKMNLDDSLVWA